MMIRTRRAGAFLIALCLLLAALPSVALAEETPAAFATPEDTIRHFVAALAQNDLQKALQSCAVEEYAAGYDFAGMLDRLKVLMPVQQMAPSEYGLFADINKISAMGTLVMQIKMMVYSFFVPEVMEGNPMYSGGGREDAERFLKAVDPSQLNSLKILRIDPPMKDILNSERNISNFQRMAELDGAQEMTERIALYELNGKTYLGGFGLLRYGEGWKILRLNSILANQSSMGIVGEITLEAYASLL